MTRLSNVTAGRSLLRAVAASPLEEEDAETQILSSKEMREHLRWMRQKFALGQDIFPFGPLRHGAG